MTKAKTPVQAPDLYPGMMVCSDQECKDFAKRVKKTHKHQGPARFTNG